MAITSAPVVPDAVIIINHKCYQLSKRNKEKNSSVISFFDRSIVEGLGIPISSTRPVLSCKVQYHMATTQVSYLHLHPLSTPGHQMRSVPSFIFHVI